MPPPAHGLIASRAVCTTGPDGQNQGTLLVFNLNSKVSANKFKEISKTLGWEGIEKDAIQTVHEIL
uniref:Uncharacterized protein n=1 Tax=Nelumbo nucifera TaxID=4432 RepID=A0A822Z3Y7_NELNU|nr:TPA_asm: hypothetical protein HUJ06_013683 [Nelumbo nucifera]